jgi:hypothetical protein
MPGHLLDGAIAFNPLHFWALFASMQSWLSSGASRTGLNTVLSGMRFDPPSPSVIWRESFATFLALLRRKSAGCR